MNASVGHEPILHILNKPPSHSRFTACLEGMADGDWLLLIEDAVIALTDSSIGLPASTRVLSADCDARGIRCDAGRVDYSGMVELTDRFSGIISW